MRKIQINGITSVELDGNRRLTLYPYHLNYACFYDLQISDYSNLKNGYGLESEIICTEKRASQLSISMPLNMAWSLFKQIIKLQGMTAKVIPLFCL